MRTSRASALTPRTATRRQPPGSASRSNVAARVLGAEPAAPLAGVPFAAAGATGCDRELRKFDAPSAGATSTSRCNVLFPAASRARNVSGSGGSPGRITSVPASLASGADASSARGLHLGGAHIISPFSPRTRPES